MRRKTRHFLLLKHDQKFKQRDFLFIWRKGKQAPPTTWQFDPPDPTRLSGRCNPCPRRFKQSIQASVFTIHILSEEITCYLRLVGIFTERCEVMLLSSTDLKKRVWRVQEAPFVFVFFLNNYKTELFPKSLLLSCEGSIVSIWGFVFVFSCFSRAHRSHNVVFVFALFLKSCLLFFFFCTLRLYSCVTPR